MDRNTSDFAETDEELLTFDVSDEALERAAPFISGQATPVTMVFGTTSSAIAPAPSRKTREAG